MMEAVTVAVITAVGGVIAALIQSLRKENRDDHAVVSDALTRIENKVDGNIRDHATGDV